jgi:hypothetical protein
MQIMGVQVPLLVPNKGVRIMSLSPYGKDCCVCNTVQTENELFVLGYIGILPVAFCENCYQGIVSMVKFLEDISDEDI